MKAIRPLLSSIMASTLVVLSTMGWATEPLSDRSALLYEAFAKIALGNERKEVVRWSRKDSITVALNVSKHIPDTIATYLEHQIYSDLSVLSAVIGKSIQVRATTPNSQSV